MILRIGVVGSLIVWTLFCGVVFSKYGYEIDEFDARVRALIRTGKFDTRYFDKDGLPVTVDARTGRRFISPFYVVHYGLIHSEALRESGDFKGIHWEKDSSLELWGGKPESLSPIAFIKNADWVVRNAKKLNGLDHLVYTFDWRYPNYPNGGLQAPWWSGLTDAYAILLLMRAYDVSSNEDYLRVARSLYTSTISPVEVGGSLVEVEGDPWIEEYVDRRAAPEDMSHVLNGMIYAYRGIKAFEAQAGIVDGYAVRLKKSIQRHIEDFSLGNWSYYDLIGNVANIKYHRIHVDLLSDRDFYSESLQPTLSSWQRGLDYPGFYWFMASNWSWARFHFLVFFLACCFMGCAVILVVSCKARRVGGR